MSLFASLTDAAYALVRPVVHATDGEAAHNLTLNALQPLPRARHALTSPALATHFAGIEFPNPVGLAPGFDKDARVAHAMPHFGFGFVEVGTLTPLPQEGNPRPRLFRLVEDGAVINRMGFNNGGQAKATERIACLRRFGLPVPLGINIGANKDSADRVADYAKGTAAMAPLADYLTVNISSPNTPGLRALQDKGALEALLDAVAAAQQTGVAVPVLLKVAPDLESADIDDIVKVALDKGIAAVIVANTTITRPPLASPHAGEAGGLSGAPLAALALQRLKDFRAASGGSLSLVAAGGIGSAEQAWERIRAGAGLVQIYSAMVYSGPGLASRIAKGLEALAARDGFARVSDAVGIDH
ncbi:quinone-dependent dihydroorotate dehydrogenase [Sphingopyxis sp. XHP0097]|uniref:Dihydroorotate dehydrogenase (quinone) n=1 Tax=Sphingopyxis jiangsuensis TaxID=2871171 RepID=A0ABS7MA64_9SPHN|nr:MULTISPECIES: quinone-dependent dihydroorotate dehydrogenase [Sphingopyxis]MBL0768368.1 quinone-dependent dihydroorotate dehydrogenase [Sphingopyxis lutea]MBY4635917.1 quinone-dependent dihydroorotate dehydrogenase [Sphingopyxis jiangsuensis]